MNKLTSICVLSLSLVCFGNAQNLTSRQSTLNYNYVFGAGGDSNVDSYSDIQTTLDASGGMTAAFGDSTGGNLPGGTPYTAGVGISLGQSYSITGPLSGFSNIQVDANSVALAESTGAGTALMSSANPGNALIFEFTVASPADFHLVGSISSDEPGVGSLVALQRFDGIVWQNTFNSLFLPGQQGAFDVTGTMSAGQYRLNSAISVGAFGNENPSGTFTYSFDVVPEPVTMFAIAPALMLLARKRKKN